MLLPKPDSLRGSSELLKSGKSTEMMRVKPAAKAKDQNRVDAGTQSYLPPV
jgi:hypothetical protein